MRLYIPLGILLCCTLISSHGSEVRNVENNVSFNQQKYARFIEGIQNTRQCINEAINRKEDLGTIWKMLSIIFENNASIKRVANRFLDINKVLCALTTILPNKESYMSVPLESIKKPCIQQKTVIATAEYKEERKEFGIKFIIKSTLEGEYGKRYLYDIDALASKVNMFLSSDPVVAGGTLVSAKSKQFMCQIADAMPRISEYSFFDLSEVRGNACLVLSDGAFLKLFLKAERKTEIMKAFGRNPCLISYYKNSGLIAC